MAAERITVIINEIKYWKEHRLLPETYCDYLLALYTNGENLTDNHVHKSKRLSPAFILHMLLVISVIPFSFLVIYFTQFHPFLQLGILLLFGIYSFWFNRFAVKHGYEVFLLPILVILLQLFLFTITLINLLTDNNIILLVVILANFLLWLWVGTRRKVKYLQALSILCIISTVLYIIF